MVNPRDIIEDTLELLDEEVKPNIDLYLYLDIKDNLESLLNQELPLDVIDYHYFTTIEDKRDQTVYARVMKANKNIEFYIEYEQLSDLQKRQVNSFILEVICTN